MSEIDTFPAIQFEPSMSTGIEAIDKQHQYLFETLSDANKYLLNSSNEYLLSQIAKDLLGYAITHFETEEGLMQRYGYDEAHPSDAKAHIAQHRFFSSQVVAVRDQLREGRGASLTEMLRFLNHWLQDHVLGIDQKLGKFLRNHPRACCACRRGTEA
jgi:hemerythrin-like metal-binding protein